MYPPGAALSNLVRIPITVFRFWNGREENWDAWWSEARFLEIGV